MLTQFESDAGEREMYEFQIPEYIQDEEASDASNYS